MFQEIIFDQELCKLKENVSKGKKIRFHQCCGNENKTEVRYNAPKKISTKQIKLGGKSRIMYEKGSPFMEVQSKYKAEASK